MSLTLLSKGASVYSSARRISNVWRTAGDPITFGPKELLAQSRDGQHLTRVDQVRIGNAAGIGDHLVFAAVAVEALRNGPQRIPRQHGVRPRSRRRWRGAGSGSAAGAGSWTAAGTTSGAGACAAGGGGATGTSSVCVFDAHAGPSNPYSTRLRSSCSSRRTSLAPLVSVCQIGL